MKLDRALNIADLKRLAARRLPPPLFHYIDGGADDEVTRRANLADFDRLRLVPEYLIDMSEVDTSTRLLGQPIEWPVMLSPTGMSRLFHHQGELAVARAAHAAGTFYSLSTLSTCTIEEVAAVSDGPKCFQIYVMRDRGLTREFIQRCRESGYAALALTVDVPVAGYRERELRYGFSLPPRPRPATLLGFARRPAWCWRHLVNPPVLLANLAHRIAQGSSDPSSLMEYVADQFDPSVDWDAMAWMIEEWGGPFAIKGILSPADAVRAAEAGCSALIVSNHGGRQLDQAVTPIQALPGIVEAVGARCEIILEGGVRRGTDVLKALALGADACAIGRPYLYGLAAGGEAGVARALALLRAEVERDLALLGCRSLRELGPGHLHPAGEWLGSGLPR